MKYCPNCGNKTTKNAKFCEYCGSSLSNTKDEDIEIIPPNENGKEQTSSNQDGKTNTFAEDMVNDYEDSQSAVYTSINTMKKYRILPLAAFIVALLATVSMGFCLIPLCWCIPMTIKAYKYYKDETSISLAYIICLLIFVSIPAGVILLVDKYIK